MQMFGKWCENDVMNESMCQKRDQVSRVSTFYANFRHQFLSFCFPFHLERNINIWCVGILFSLNLFSHVKTNLFIIAWAFSAPFHSQYFWWLCQELKVLRSIGKSWIDFLISWELFSALRTDSVFKYELIRFSSPRLCFSRHQNRPKAHKASDCFTFPSHSPEFFTFSPKLFRFAHFNQIQICEFSDEKS